MSKILTITKCGKEGRFGNQILHYLGAKAIATSLGVELQVPHDWIGRLIFDVKDPPITKRPNAQTPLDYIPAKEDFEKYDTIDFWGYCQNQKTADLYSISDIKKWLPIQKQWLNKFSPIYDNECVIHKRRGDYVNKLNMYCCITDQSYDAVLAKAKDDYGAPLYVQYLTEENPTIDDECEELGIGFLPDWMKMVGAAVLIRSNSTFGVTASWYNTIYHRGTTWSPVVGDLVGWQEIPFIKGNAPKCASSLYHAPSILTDMHLEVCR